MVGKPERKTHHGNSGRAWYDITTDITYLLNYLFTYSLTQRSTVLLERLTGFQRVKKFPAFYGTRRYITAVTSARRLPLS
jgi:hypothetical protein